MSGKAQITAKIGGDSTGLQKELRGVQASFGRFAQDLGKKMKAAAVAGMAGVAAGIAASLKNGFNQKVMLEQSEALMKSLMGGAEKAKNAMAMLAAEAKENQMFSKTAMTQAGATLATVAQGNTARLQSMVETAQRLSVLNPGQGITGAAEALQKAVSGDYGDLAEQFKIPQTTVDALQKAGFQGQRLVDQALAIQGVTDQSVKDQGNTVGGRMAQLRSKWDDFSLKLMDKVWPKIEEFINKALEFFTTHMPEIAKATELIANTLTKILEKISHYLDQFDKGTQAASDAWFSDKNVLRKNQDNMAAGLDFYRNIFGGMGIGAAWDQANAQVKGAQLGARSKEVQAKIRIDASGYNGVPKMMGAT